MKIISNTAISLDGKIAPALGDVVALGSEEDLRELSRIRGRADAILVGGRTYRHWPMPFLPRAEHRSRDYLKQPLWNAVVTRGPIAIPESVLNEKKVRPLIFTAIDNVSALPPVEIEKSANNVTPEWIVSCLEKRGVETLLIEAGGDLIAQFIEARLVDEMYVTVCPKLIGGKDAPSLMGGTGFAAEKMPQLKLLSHRLAGDEIFLHYRVVK